MPENPENAEKASNAAIIYLVSKAKDGNAQAFSQLYDFYFDKIFKFIFYRVSHKETAEDLCEDVFVKAWTKIRNVGDDSFGGWLYSIAKNRIIDHYRQNKSTVDISEVENILEAEENIIENANLQFDQKILLDAVRKLPPEQQIVIQLKFIEGLENSEIAELIAKKEGAIRVLQHRAIQNLQKLYGEKNLPEKIFKSANAEH